MFNTITNILNDENNVIFDSLNQGKKFINYQNNLQSKIEPFSMLNQTEIEINNNDKDNELSNQTRDVLNNTDMSKEEQKLQNIKSDYIKSLNEYNQISSELSNDIQNNYIDRVSPNNPYLNKMISIRGMLFYVTNKGIARFYPTHRIFYHSIRLGCPNNEPINLDHIVWNSKYTNPGHIIPTTPALLTGPRMKYGEICGYEGDDVLVNKYISDDKIKLKYKGCYVDNVNGNVDYIGEKPSPPFKIFENGNFDKPKLNSNSYMYYDYAGYKGGIMNIVGLHKVKACFLNESKDWGFPMPYPLGKQCISLQKTSIIIPEFVSIDAGDYVFSIYACGRPRDSGINEVEITYNHDLVGKIVPVKGEWKQYTFNYTLTETSRGYFRIKGTWNSSDRSTAIQGINFKKISNNSSGTFSFEKCKQSAINAGYRFFGLQNVNSDDNLGYCAVSNNNPLATKDGISYIYTKDIIWESDTHEENSYAAVSENGSLQVINKDEKVLFSTDNTKAPQGNFQGCFRDRRRRAMGKYTGRTDYETCLKRAEDGNYNYFALQDSRSGKNAQCYLENDINRIKKYGTVPRSCALIEPGRYSGLAWTNAVYNTKESSAKYFVRITTNRMFIRLGEETRYIVQNPDLFEVKSDRNNKIKNPHYESKKNKFKTDRMITGQTLQSGEWLSNNDGSRVLEMRADGNLIFYQFKKTTNCKTYTSGDDDYTKIYGGGINANALYDIGSDLNKEHIGKVGRIDEAGNLRFTSNNNKYINNYTKYSYNDMPGNLLGHTKTEDENECLKLCNKNNKCKGITYEDDNCYMHSEIDYDKLVYKNTNTNTYLKNQVINEGFEDMNSNKNIKNMPKLVDSNTYQELLNKRDFNTWSQKYGFNESRSSVKENKKKDIKLKLNKLSSQMDEITNRINTNQNEVNTQSMNISNSNKKFMDEYTDINNKLKYLQKNGELENILQNSNIDVLRESYNYTFWSILATATLLVTLNVVKK